MSTSLAAKTRLMSEYKALQKEKWVKVELKDDTVFKWSVALMVINPESYYNGGFFKAEMTFTNSYPYSPPTFKFDHPIYHPNVYPDGKLCISILHAPGADEMSGELATERWSPLQGAESVLRSILLLLDDPETSSPANVDAGVLYRKDREAYIKKANENVERSRQDIPSSFTVPTSLEEVPPEKNIDDEGFWAESEAEEDFGGSDSSGEDAEDFDEDGNGDQDFEESGEEEQGAEN